MCGQKLPGEVVVWAGEECLRIPLARQVGVALFCLAVNQMFGRHFSRVAQLVEQLTVNQSLP